VSTPPAIRALCRLATRLAACVAAASAVLVAVPACHKPAYVVEGRWSPVHVVVEAPAAAAATQQVTLRVTIGDQVAVDGPVVFPAGRTRVDLPTVHVPAGVQDVDVAIAGRPAAHSTAAVGHATWVRVTLTGGGAASILVSDRDPSGAR
jgi:hypothetical protein